MSALVMSLCRCSSSAMCQTREFGNERERVGRVHRQRRQHRENRAS